GVGGDALRRAVEHLARAGEVATAAPLDRRVPTALRLLHADPARHLGIHRLVVTGRLAGVLEAQLQPGGRARAAVDQPAQADANRLLLLAGLLGRQREADQHVALVAGGQVA